MVYVAWMFVAGAALYFIIYGAVKNAIRDARRELREDGGKCDDEQRESGEEQSSSEE